MANSDYYEYEDHDGIKEGKASVPKGWKWYVYATIAWMIYYVIAYMPSITGWTQSAGID